MRILITNDDGITSSILPAFVRWAKTIGYVTVVVPQSEQSGKSQSIDFRSEIEVKKVVLDGDIEAYTVASTPADCVRFALEGLKKKYDIVMSGINIGYNLGDDIAYSGTLGAILEGARCGIMGLAISAHPPFINDAPAHLDYIYDWITEKKLYDHARLFNINIPPIVEGIRITRQGGVFYTDTFVHCGGDMYKQIGAPLEREFNDLDVDIDAIMNNLISVTPITASKTDFTAFHLLK